VNRRFTAPSDVMNHACPRARSRGSSASTSARAGPAAADAGLPHSPCRPPHAVRCVVRPATSALQRCSQGPADRCVYMQTEHGHAGLQGCKFPHHLHRGDHPPSLLAVTKPGAAACATQAGTSEQDGTQRPAASPTWSYGARSPWAC
jgi:hypothetical protein